MEILAPVSSIKSTQSGSTNQTSVIINKVSEKAEITVVGPSMLRTNYINSQLIYSWGAPPFGRFNSDRTQVIFNNSNNETVYWSVKDNV